MINTKNAIEKIHEFEKFGSVLGLKRMAELMKRLQNPEREIKYFHVAGTNGKGSVCRYIYEILRQNGYKTGLYTSPFINDFNERIEFDGESISDSDLNGCAEEVILRVEEMVRAGFESPTEFEIITAIAFVYFKKVRADIVVLEVGLGGRGDSTNVIGAPLVSVITSISYDHMDRLGDTLSQIAAEKAGIIKQGVPVVVNVSCKEAADVIAKTADEKKSPRFDVTQNGYTLTNKSIFDYTFDANICEFEFKDIQISMIGDHQIQNALTALTATCVAWRSGAIKLSVPEIKKGIKKAIQIGRFEMIRDNPVIVLDGAHNEEGINALKKTMKEHFAGKRILVVCGMLSDKDVSKMSKHLSEIADDFIATEPDNPRKLASDKLCETLLGKNKRCVTIPRPAEAFRYAMKQSKNFDVILFAGSLYLIGEMRRMLYYA